MTFLLAFLTLTIVNALPTTTNQTLPTKFPLSVRTAPPTSPHPTKPRFAVNTSTLPTNTTEENEHEGIRGSIEKELAILRTSFQNMRKDIDEWMNTPYHKNVVIPAMIGVLSAIIAVSFYHLLKIAIRGCARRFRRYRLSRLTCEINGDKKHMLSKKGDSDDEDDI